MRAVLQLSLAQAQALHNSAHIILGNVNVSFLIRKILLSVVLVYSS